MDDVHGPSLQLVRQLVTRSRSVHQSGREANSRGKVVAGGTPSVDAYIGAGLAQPLLERLDVALLTAANAVFAVRDQDVHGASSRSPRLAVITGHPVGLSIRLLSG
jgi:hypothetical protein